MAIGSELRTSVAAGARPRLPGPDVVRGAALVGVVVMNYHGYLYFRGGELGTGWAADLFDWRTGPLTTRFAATFVLVAGVGVTLLTRRTRTDASRITPMRWRLVRRGAALYVGGVFLDVIWPGTIIPYYGVMFVIAALIFTLRSRWIVAIGVAAALAGWAIRSWRFDRERAGASTTWLTQPDGDPRAPLFDVFVNGTHPLLPWLVFLCAGIVLGRVLGSSWWRPVALVGGLALYAAARLVEATATTPFEQVLWSTTPRDRGMAYVASALGTALVAYAVLDWLANRLPRATDPLRRAGQMSLTLYLGHIAVFEILVDQLGWIDPAGLDLALVFSLCYWVVALVFAVWWSDRYGRGPAERLYRAIGG